MMFDVLDDEPNAEIARELFERLSVLASVKPIASRAFRRCGIRLTCHAMLEIGNDEAQAAACEGLDWLLPHQVLYIAGDGGATRRPMCGRAAGPSNMQCSLS